MGSEAPDVIGEREVDSLFAGGGELGALLRDLDWSQTSLGSPATWPQALKTCVRIMLTSRQPIWIGWGPELVYMYNDPYKAIIGGKHPEALGRPTSVVWSEIWDVIEPMLSTAMSGVEGTYVEAQLLIMERYGYEEETYYTFSYSPVPNDEGGIGGIICANTDDTQRVIGERQMALLRELAARTADARTVEDVCELSAAALETNRYDLPFGLIYLIDPADRSVARLAGRTGMDCGHPAAPDVLPLDGTGFWPLTDSLHTHAAQIVDLVGTGCDYPGGAWDRPPAQAAILPIAPTGETGRGGFLVAGLNPFRLFDEGFHGFMRLVAGQISGSLGNAEAYQVEKNRAEALAELDRAKTTFFSNISHELRTPLTLMLGPLEDLLRGDVGQPLRPEHRAELEVTHRNSQRLLRLVNTLLDFSRIEAGRTRAVYEPTDLAQFTAELASTFRSAIERAGLRLSVDTPPLPEPVYVDREMWEKIVLNFLSNAFKFTLEGEIAVSLRPVDGAVELTVRDTGAGIPAEELPQVFERFHRVRGVQGRTHEGSGIGLALVQELVRMHGGDVSVESTPGAGSTFRVRIPTGSSHLPQDRIEAGREGASTAIGATAYVEEAMRWLPAAQRTADDEPALDLSGDAPADIAAASHRGALILVADDNADMRDYVARLLGQQRYRVETVSDGESAFEAAREMQPDLILSDVMMPRMDGFELVQALRSDSRTREIPIILLSARAGEESRVEGIEAGADDYLVKPFSARELTARVGAHLELTRVRRDAQTAIRESEERLRLALDAAQFGSWDLDLRSRRSPVRSPRHDEIFGYSTPLADWSYERFLEHVVPEDRPEVDRLFHEALERDDPWDFECRINRADGQLRWIWGRGGVLRDTDGTPVRALGIVSDITERKQREQQLRRLTAELETERSRLHEIFQQAPAIIATVRGPSHVFESANPLYLQVVGHRDIIGKPVAEALPEVVEQGFVDLLDTVYRTGEAFVATEMPVLLDRTGDGTLEDVYVNFVYQPLRDDAGAVSGIFVHAVDVTDQVVTRRRIEELQAETEAINEELQESNEELAERSREAEAAREEAEEANRTKSSFLANMSHELRTPLNAIIGYADLLSAEIVAPLVEGQRQQLERIEIAARHLLRIIEEILTFSRIEAGREAVHLEAADVGELARETASLIEPLARENGLTFSSRTPEGLVIETDPGKVRQILLNLLSNAVKFTETGTVTMEVRREETEAVIVVEDTGIGIAPEHQARIFEPFSQVEQGPRRRAGGTGLGLTVTAQLADLLGGGISLESTPGKGSRFEVRLPVDRPATQ